MRDKKYAKIIAKNLKVAFRKFKDSNEEKCPCCGQSLKNAYTQEWLAEAIGVKKPTIIHYFQGNREPSVGRLIKIAEIVKPEIF